MAFERFLISDGMLVQIPAHMFGKGKDAILHLGFAVDV